MTAVNCNFLNSYRICVDCSVYIFFQFSNYQDKILKLYSTIGLYLSNIFIEAKGKNWLIWYLKQLSIVPDFCIPLFNKKIILFSFTNEFTWNL